MKLDGCNSSQIKYLKSGMANPNFSYTGVQGINNVFHIIKKFENVLENTYIFNLINHVEYVVYALYSSKAVFMKIDKNLAF